MSHYKVAAATIAALLLVTMASAQSVSVSSGARAAGLAYASSCIADEWSLFNNVAGLAYLTKPAAGVACHVKPQLPGATRMAGVVCVPLKTGVVSAGMYRFGDDVYNEQLFSAGFSNKLGIAALGIRMSYIQYAAEGFGTRGMLSISMGGIASLSPNVKIGAHITNINQPKVSERDNEYLPVTMAIGAGITPSEKVFLTVEVEKDIEFHATWKVATEYKPVKKFAIRSGFNLYPNALFLGVGLTGSRLHINYALDHRITIGTGHQVSVNYWFRSR